MSETEPSALAPETSPLLEADPGSLDELITSGRIDDIFNRPSALRTDADLRVIVAYYRKERERFLTESQAKANKEPKPRKAKVPKSVDEVVANLPGAQSALDDL